MLTVNGMDGMDVFSAASNEFAKRDSLIMSMKKNNFQRLAGEICYTRSY